MLESEDKLEKKETTYLLPGTWVYGKTTPGAPITSYGVAGNGAERNPEGGSIICSGQHGRAQSGLGIPLTSFFLVSQVAGLGILALPWAISLTGWAGLGVLVIAGVCVAVSACHLATSWVILEERWPEYQQACRKPYPAMAYRSLGRAGWHIVNVVQCATLFGVSIVTILLSAELLESMVGSLLPDLSICSWVVSCGCVLVPLSWIGSPRSFWPASILALLATVAAVLVVLVKIMMENPSSDPKYPPVPSWYSFFLGYGTIMFSYGGVITFPTIQNDMADRSKFPHALVISFGALLAMYVPLAGLGYLEFGSDVNMNVLLSVSGPSVTTVQALMMLNNVFTYVMLINPLSQSFEEALSLSAEFGWRRCVLRTTIVILGVLVSLAIKNFGRTLNLIGSCTVPFLTFVLPPIFYIRLCDSSSDNENWPKRELSLPHRLMLWLLIVVGGTSGLVATWTSLQALFVPAEATASCYTS